MVLCLKRLGVFWLENKYREVKKERKEKTRHFLRGLRRGRTRCSAQRQTPLDASLRGLCGPGPRPLPHGAGRRPRAPGAARGSPQAAKRRRELQSRFGRAQPRCAAPSPRTGSQNVGGGGTGPPTAPGRRRRGAGRGRAALPAGSCSLAARHSCPVAAAADSVSQRAAAAAGSGGKGGRPPGAGRGTRRFSSRSRSVPFPSAPAGGVGPAAGRRPPCAALSRAVRRKACGREGGGCAGVSHGTRPGWAARAGRPRPAVPP